MPGPKRIALVVAGTMVSSCLVVGLSMIYLIDQWGLLVSVVTSAAFGAIVTSIVVRLAILTITDEGTGLYNRRHLYREISKNFSRAKKYDRSLSLLFIDLDDFRVYNNSYGHLAGDIVLRSVAAAIRSGLRRKDVVGRWGGEEFAAILTDCELDEALAVAERIRQAVGQLTIDIGQPSTVKATISAGVASLDRHASMEQLIHDADMAMYDAKLRKNQVLPARGTNASSPQPIPTHLNNPLPLCDDP